MKSSKLILHDFDILLRKNWSIIEVKNSTMFYHQFVYKISSKIDNIYIIDCGNSINPYIISTLAKYEKKDVFFILNKIKISRVFTVFQLETAILKVLKHLPEVVFITDIDKILKDEGISDKEKIVTIKSSFKHLSKVKFSIFITFGSKIYYKVNKEIGLWEKQYLQQPK